MSNRQGLPAFEPRDTRGKCSLRQSFRHELYDSRAGTGGRGGRGGKCHQHLGGGFGSYDYPNGRDGRNGLPGKVETVIEDGW